MAGQPTVVWADAIPAELTSLVGREKLLEQAERLLRAVRLITFTGIGGIGKTRLALRLGAVMSGSFPDGVRLLDLADVAGTGVADLLAAACDGPPDRRLLLVLDNCDHLVESLAPPVTALLRAVTGLRLLATSRQRLGLPGEHVLPVPPLGLPDGEDLASVQASDAVRLLVARAMAVDAGIRLTAANCRAVAGLCQRLEGIPLAIELAATRLRTLPIDEMLLRADDRFRLLTDHHVHLAAARHRSMRAVLDASYQLCSAQERLLWAWLSVFPGEFDLPAAESVCTGEGIAGTEVMDLLAGLVDKSVVTVTRQDRSRCRLLDIIREYGQLRLAELGPARRAGGQARRALP